MALPSRAVRMSTWNGKKPIGEVEQSVDVLDRLNWTVQPPLGLLKGEYFRAECDFAPHFPGDQGYHGILEVVRGHDRLVHVEFNELTAPSYYKRLYQNASKRRGSFCFYQATKARTEQTLVVLDNGIKAVEEQMLRENRLTGDFDLITGASNSVRRGMLPLARQISGLMAGKSQERYYGMAVQLGNGVTPRLEVVTRFGQIQRLLYDEIFADDQADIVEPKWKPFYRQSKRFCLEYESSYPDGFNTLFDLVEKRVVLTQDLLDLTGLPWTKDTETRQHNPEYDHYLQLATIIKAAIETDHAK